MRSEPLTPPLPSILLVEDEAANRALVRAIAERARGIGPFELLEASRLVEARELLRTRRVSAILLDVRLPDGDGLDLASEVRSRPLDEQPWIVVMSASVHRADQERALDAGADVFLGKPIRADDLVALLRRVLAQDATQVRSVDGDSTCTGMSQQDNPA